MRLLTPPQSFTLSVPVPWQVPVFALVLMLVAYPSARAAQEAESTTDTTEAVTQEQNQADEADAGQDLETALLSPDPAVLAQAREDKLRYEQVISALENATSQNVYNPELTEAYLNLAGVLEVLEENEAAAAVYDKALQTVRISSGLNSLQQLPVLEQLLENNLARGDWENVDNFAHLIFHIARRNYPVGDIRRVEALDRLATWKLRAIRESLFDGGSRSAFETVAMFRSEITLLEESGNFDGKGIQLATLHLGEARGQLEVARQINERPLSDYRTTSQQTISQQQCRTIRLPNGQVTTVCETVEVPNMEFYLDPAARKNQEIRIYLGNIRDAISAAFTALQEDGDVARRTELAEEMQSLTQAYNTFITENRL